MKISLVIPAFNEEESLPILQGKVQDVMEENNYDYEVIYIDDGSSDNTAGVLEELQNKDKNVKAVILRRNFGQSAATAAGLDKAKGDIIVVMDSDLQNDPADIPKLIDKIKGGADIVSGWRKNRKDNKIIRNFPSWVANNLIRSVSKLQIHDLGCSLKAYRKEIIKEVRLYGEMHRFIAIYANMIGAKVDEVVVSHHPRQYGESKYGLSRIFKVLMDLITLKYMLNYSTKPIYFFGKIAVVFFALGFAAFVGLFIHKFFGASFVRSPLLLVTSLLSVVGIQTLLSGVLAEIVMRTYHESQDKPTYYVKKTHEDLD